MTPYWSDDWLTVYEGDARTALAELPAESVHCVVTSPPYWGLRDYGVPGQLGLEPTPEAYVEAMVGVFREVRRVLRADGTLWLNLGDGYNAYNGGAGPSSALSQTASRERPELPSGYGLRTKGLKPKDLLGMPWRVAFALQADGWYLRSDIIWAKPNAMPESVTDRPTKSHEYLFLLSKAPRYYYDAEAVREVSTTTRPELLAFGDERPDVGYPGHVNDRRRDKQRASAEASSPSTARRMGGFNDRWDASEHNGTAPVGRNLRSVWTIATEPYPGAHFATFPRKLVEPCVKAGTSERGVCPECGAPWVRETKRSGDDRIMTREQDLAGSSARRADGTRLTSGTGQRTLPGGAVPSYRPPTIETTGWRPGCAHIAEPTPATVLDPFAGSGTVGLVAQSLSRRAVLIDLNADYLRQCLERNRQMPLGVR